MGSVKEMTIMANDTQPQAQTNGAQTTALAPKAAAAPVPVLESDGGLVSPFGSSAGFQWAQRMASSLASSSLVPEQYRATDKNPKEVAIANCLIAMELASRVGGGMSVLMVMQNLYIVHGNPGWSAKFLIASVNKSGRFTPLRFRFQGREGSPEWGCRAVATDIKSGEELIGTFVSLKMAADEGWLKNPKWKSMPEQMLQYRSAAFWTRTNCPEISMGFQTAEELNDVYGGPGTPVDALPPQLVPAGAASLNETLGLKKTAQVVDAPQEPEQQTLEVATAEPTDLGDGTLSHDPPKSPEQTAAKAKAR